MMVMSHLEVSVLVMMMCMTLIPHYQKVMISTMVMSHMEVTVLVTMMCMTIIPHYLKVMNVMLVMCMTDLLPSLSHKGPNTKELRIIPTPEHC